MVLKYSRLQKMISLTLIFAITLSFVGCSKTSVPPNPTLSDPNPKIIVENVITENVITEEVTTEEILHEFITTEIYLEEIVVVENKITELLLEEEIISEVLSCKTIYVPQDHLEEFAKKSQNAQLFGDNVDITSLLTKVSLGTGVIVTITILKKAGFSDPIASAVAAAAEKLLKFAGSGAAIGTLFGGLTGAANEIDPSGRTSAVIAFATATAGLILSIIELVGAIPSGGATIAIGEGVKLVFAGISVLSATVGTTYAGYQAVKSFTATDSAEIDWDNIDWEKVGVSSAEKAIKNAADGYMWGAIVGAVYGGIEGYDFYQKYNTPYTEYNARLTQTPKQGNGGKWSGERGESDFVLDTPIELKDGTKITKVTYKNAVPDFSPYQKAQVKISDMTNIRSNNFKKADDILAKHWTKIKYKGRSWTRSDVEAYRSSNKLTWHEMSNMESMQLVPQEVNQTFTHFGGVAEYNAMIGEKGKVEYE